MKIALYEYLPGDSRVPGLHKAEPWMEEEDSDFLLISNIIEVEFQMIDDALIIPKKVKALEIEKEKFNAKINERISKLMALPHLPQGEEEGS